MPLRLQIFTSVIPAKAGIHPSTTPVATMDSRFRGNDGREEKPYAMALGG
jgi:hypothetical protein